MYIASVPQDSAKYLTQYYKIFPEKIIVAQIVKKLPVLYGTRCFMTVTTRAASDSYTEPNKSSTHPLTYFL
jgi:hypothetical protein